MTSQVAYNPATNNKNANSHDQVLSAIANRILFCPSEERTARELQSLAPAERQQVWADMKGNPETTKYRINAESAEFLAERLLHLDQDLMKIANPTKEAFNLALEMAPDFVNDITFRLMFLRADDFDTQAAALRMVLHFKVKLELFGKDKLGRHIKLSDLSADDKESLQSGGFQLLPRNDRTERMIMFTRQRNYRYKTHKNMLRAFWYTGFTAAESVLVQKLGAISVSYQVGGYPEGGYDYELTRKISELVKGSPIRFVAIYVCFSETPWKRVAELISHVVSPLLRVRLRSIQGSHQECLYQLMAMGIPHDSLPVTSNGDALLFNHQRWLEERQAIEAAEQSNTPYPDCNVYTGSHMIED